MLLNAYFWPTALLFAAFSAAFAFWLGMTASADNRRSRYDDEKKAKFSPTSSAMTAAALAFFIDLLLQRINLYYFQPNLTGSFFGYFSPILIALVPAMIIGCLFASFSRKSVTRTIVTVLVLFGWPTVQWSFNAIGPDNAKNYADLPNVRIADAKETIPPTDEQHLVQVTPDMAALKAKTVLSRSSQPTATILSGHRFLAAVQRAPATCWSMPKTKKRSPSCMTNFTSLSSRTRTLA
jgi:hypothetical protein